MSIERFIQVRKTSPRSELIVAYDEMMATHSNDLAFLVISAMNSSGIHFEEFLKSLSAVEESRLALLLSPSLPTVIDTLLAREVDHASVSLLLNILSSAILGSPVERLSTELPPASAIAVANLAIANISSPNLSMSEICCVLSTNLTQYTTSHLPQLASIARENAQDSILVTRYASVMARILGLGDAQFDASLESGLVGVVVACCHSSDVLVKLVALEMLTEFANHQKSLHYFITEGLLQWLVDVAQEVGSQADPLLTSQALRTVSLVFDRAAEKGLLNKSFVDDLERAGMLRRFMSCISSHFEASDEGSRLAGETEPIHTCLASPTPSLISYHNSHCIYVHCPHSSTKQIT